LVASAENRFAKRFQGVSLAHFPGFIAERAQIDLGAMGEKLDEVIGPDAFTSVGGTGDSVGSKTWGLELDMLSSRFIVKTP
jgi:hypothetical protein